MDSVTDRKRSDLKKARRDRNPPVLPINPLNESLIRHVVGGSTPKTGNSRKKPKVKIKFQKWDLDNEPWNLKRSPCLARLKNSLSLVKEGKNPFFKFKDLLTKIKIRTLGEYNRYMTILEGGLILTRKPIGIKVTPLIRKVKTLSFRDIEIIVSKLPYWASSYESCDIQKLAGVAKSHSSYRCAKQCRPKGFYPPPGPMNPWYVRSRSNQTLLEGPTGPYGR
jgi:hypothetical protein